MEIAMEIAFHNRRRRFASSVSTGEFRKQTVVLREEGKPKPVKTATERFDPDDSTTDLLGRIRGDGERRDGQQRDLPFVLAELVGDHALVGDGRLAHRYPDDVQQRLIRTHGQRIRGYLLYVALDFPEPPATRGYGLAPGGTVRNTCE